MNPSELAGLMLKWEKAHQREQNLAQRIERAVLVEEKSVTTGNVYARYSKGRSTYGWQAAGANAPEDVVGKHTTTKIITTTDWRAVCQEVEIEPLVSKKGIPSVSIKIKPC